MFVTNCEILRITWTRNKSKRMSDRKIPLDDKNSPVTKSNESPAQKTSATKSRYAPTPSSMSKVSSSQSSGMRQFKKCKSATFQIDGQTYTIGKNNCGNI